MCNDRRENVMFILELLYRQGIVNIHYTGKEDEFQFWFYFDSKAADSSFCSGIVRCGLNGYDLLLQPKGWEKADQDAKNQVCGIKGWLQRCYIRRTFMSGIRDYG